MSRLILGLLVVVILPTAGNDPPKDDLKPFQGSWTLIKGHVGENMMLRMGNTYAWIIEKDKCLSLRNGKLAPQSVTIRVNSNANPKTIDIFDKGEANPAFALGIYEFDGVRLRIRYNKVRPTSFEAEEPKAAPFDVVMEFQKD